MEEYGEKRMIAHHLIRALILGGIAFYIVRLQTSDHLTLYIVPRMGIYVKLAAIGLYAVAVAQVYQALKAWNGYKDDCGCEHPPSSSLLRSLALYGLFIVPLGLFFLSPDTTIGSAMAAKKGITLSTSAGIKALENGLRTAAAPAKEDRQASSTVLSAAADPTIGTDSPTDTSPTVTSQPESWSASAQRDAVRNGYPADKANSAIPSPDAAANGYSADAPQLSSPDKNAGVAAVPSDDSKAHSNAAGASDAELKKLFPADEYTQDYAKYGMILYKQPLISVKEKNYMEILTTVDLYPDNFVGKKMTIEGFVYRDDTLGDNRFILGRFAVQCCTADAVPYGVLIDSADARLYKNDSWLRMTGTIGKTTYNDAEVILLKAEKTEKIKPSGDPYVYPDPDFGS